MDNIDRRSVLIGAGATALTAAIPAIPDSSKLPRVIGSHPVSAWFIVETGWVNLPEVVFVGHRLPGPHVIEEIRVNGMPVERGRS